MNNLNEEQKLCLEQIDGNILVLSGAGTGKTRLIIARFLKYLELGINKEEILCVTFSNKAANEISQRLKNNNIPINGLWIGTFHGICFRLMQIYGYIAKNISIIDENDQSKIGDKLDIKKYLQDIRLFKDNMPFEETIEFKAAYKKYQEFLNNNNLIDFADIIAKCFTMLVENPSICELIQNKFKYILVDEYQDTSEIQNEIIKMISKNNVCCVGDDDQSIYSWRGACVKNILEFDKHFQNPKVFKLQRNYRCTKSILGVSNHIISQNSARMKKELWTENDGDTVNIVSTRYEGDFIARTIQNLPENQTIGILCRNTKLFNPIEMSLVKFGINYKVFHGTRFFDKLEIKTALAYLKFIICEDILSIERVLTTPKKGIGPKKIEKLIQQIQNGLSLISALKESGCGEIAELLTKWKHNLNLSPSDFLDMIWIDSGCDKLFEDREENIKLLKDKLNQFESIEEFLNNFFMIDTDENVRVSMMTIHSSKGLEFDNVFLPGLVEGVLPSVRSLSEAALEEERRVAYVGCTRAKHKLFISYNITQSVMRSNLFGPSRFLFNLPKNSISYEII